MDREGDPRDRAAYASNWRTVLAVDAALGLVVAAVGLALSLFVSAVGPGAALGTLGLVYLLLVVSRYRRWRRLRAEAGLGLG